MNTAVKIGPKAKNITIQNVAIVGFEEAINDAGERTTIRNLETFNNKRDLTLSGKGTVVDGYRGDAHLPASNAKSGTINTRSNWLKKNGRNIHELMNTTANIASAFGQWWK